MRCDGARAASVVAGHEDCLYVHRVQPLDGSRGACLHGIAEGEQSEQPGLVGHIDQPGHGAPLRSKAIGLRNEGVELDFQLVHQSRTTQTKLATAHDGCHATPRDRMDVRGRCHLDSLDCRSPQHRLGQRVLAPGLDRRARGEKFLSGTVRRKGFHQCRLAFGQGPGLVEGDDANGMGNFESFGVFDEDAVSRRDAGAGHDRRGCCEAERTGAGDDQYRDGVEDGLFPLAGAEPPGKQRQPGDADDDRHEDRADAVDQTLDRRLLRLRRLDHAHDPGQLRFGADGSRLHERQAFAVDRPAGHPAAGLASDRQALAGDQRLVQMARAFLHGAVHRHALAGLDDDEVADANLGDRHFDLGGSAPDSRGLRTKGIERSDRLGRLLLGSSLQPLAEKNERDDDGRCLEVEVAHTVAAVQEQLVDAQPEGGRRAERDKQVHVAGAGAQGAPARAVEPRTQPELDRRGKGELQPAVEHPIPAEQQAEHRQRQRKREGRGDGDRPPASFYQLHRPRK